MQKTSSAKRLPVRGEVDSRILPLASPLTRNSCLAGRERIGQKNEKDRHVSSKLKQQVSKKRNDTRFAAADKNRVAAIE